MACQLRGLDGDLRVERDAARFERGPARAPSDWLETFAGWLPGFHVRALLSPLVLWLSARWLLNSHPLRRELLHAGLSVLFAFIYAGLHALVIGLFWPHDSQWLLFQKILLGDFTNGILTYWAVLLAGHALAFYVWYRERGGAARLDARLRAAELETLRMQLNPHFLFNTLNTIGVLMKEDTGEAGRLLVRLSDLLRSVLANRSSQQTDLRQELALLDNYLEIERSRFGDRLHIERHVDPDDSRCDGADAPSPTHRGERHPAWDRHAGKAGNGHDLGRASRRAAPARSGRRRAGLARRSGRSQGTRHRAGEYAGASREAVWRAATAPARREPSGGAVVRIAIPFRPCGASAHG